MAQKRAEMIEETRAKLISAARAAFATVGYADSSMDELTAQAGLTRGALYHHFGGKKGLLEAVIAQIDAEISGRLAVIVEEAEFMAAFQQALDGLRDLLTQLGTTIYHAQSVALDAPQAFFVPNSQLKALRRDAIEALMRG